MIPTSRRFPIAAAVLVLAAAPLAVPVPSTALPRPGEPPAVVNIFDVERRFDANDLDLWTGNDGSIGFDRVNGNAGLVFPRGSGHTVVFASGLWVGAQVGGEVRVTSAEYAVEWAPGRIVGGASEAHGDPALRSYKVVPIGGFAAPPDSGALASLTGDPVAHEGWGTYVAEGGPKGAPIGLFAPGVQGPDLPGRLALWSVFNDADPTFHVSDIGSTPPLMLEVRQAVFGFGAELPGVAFVRWTIVHRGTVPLDSAYVAFWSDPDLGASNDDKVGYDAARALGYAYNGQPNDAIYGAAPPATGIAFLEGPSDGSLAGFATYTNGTDPSMPIEAYRMLQGLTREGNERIDPTTSLPSRFAFTGDPVAGTGWLDPANADKRFILSLGPMSIAPGQSRTFVFAVLAAQGKNQLDSVARLRCRAIAAREAAKAHYVPPFPEPDPECDFPIPVALTLEEAAFEGGAVRLAWYAAGPNAGPYALARRRDDAVDWEPLGTLSVGGDRRVRYEDRDVAPGERWTYGLFDASRPGTLLDAVTVTVPGSTTELALRVDGGGSTTGSRVHFGIPARGPARLEWYDVTGRRLGTEALGTLDAGTYARALPTFVRRRSAGLVFVRLVFAGSSRAARGVIF